MFHKFIFAILLQRRRGEESGAQKKEGIIEESFRRNTRRSDFHLWSTTRWDQAGHDADHPTEILCCWTGAGNAFRGVDPGTWKPLSGPKAHDALGPLSGSVLPSRPPSVPSLWDAF